jgi:hypothetical protein
MREGRSTFDIQKELGIPRPNLQSWQRGGFIKPSIEEAHGRGTRNVFSEEDVCQILLFQTLCDAGLSQRLASEYSGDLSWEIKKSNRYLLVTRRREGRFVSGEKKTAGDIPSEVPAGGVLIVVDLEQIRAKAYREL